MSLQRPFSSSPHASAISAASLTHTLPPVVTRHPVCARSPLTTRTWPRNLNFVVDGQEIIGAQVVKPVQHDGAPSSPTPPAPVRAYLAAGFSEKIVWDPKTVRAAVVTCGGLCPGLNTVVREVRCTRPIATSPRETAPHPPPLRPLHTSTPPAPLQIVMCLHYVYGVQPGNVFGIQNGYRGFYDVDLPWRVLTPDVVSPIHQMGGTVLGSSRGGFDLDKILNAVIEKGINMLFIIGGDGTHRGALALLKGATAKHIKLSVACVPKTIDNDIAIIDKTFGFDTAVEEAVRPIECAHTECRAAKGGIGLVKLMGRAAGFIALFASLASRDVNVTLLPEAPWRVSKLMEYLEKRLEGRGHCLIVVAEGAESIEQKEAKAAAAASGAANSRKDESGNVLFDDIGLFLKDAIDKHFKARNRSCTVKYIDPSYIIR